MGRLKVIIMALVLWMSALQGIWAQETVERQEASKPSAVTGWYGGIEGGVPFGFSTFSSFGADKVRAGYAFGLFGGYRFNPVLSADISMKWGKNALSARECCAASDYWLGADGNTYHSPVAGMDGYDYAELKSIVSLQQYGVRLNVNLLGFFAATRQSRWTLEVSPMLAAVGTKATVKTLAGNNNLMQDNTRWHLGAGGNLQAGYRLTEHLRVGVYSGITWLTGKGMDGIAEHVHDANLVWESGVRVGWTFGKSRKKTSVAPVIQEPAREVCPEKPEIQEAFTPDTVTIQHADSLPDKVETEIIAVETEDEVRLTFPTVYFGFNRTDIRSGETAKLQAIHDLLCEYPDVHILVTGWCDTVGSRTVNDRISRQRAEAVKAWLIRHGIKAERIRTQGKGIDHDEPDSKKARRAVTEEAGKEARP